MASHHEPNQLRLRLVMLGDDHQLVGTMHASSVLIEDGLIVKAHFEVVVDVLPAVLLITTLTSNAESPQAS